MPKSDGYFGIDINSLISRLSLSIITVEVIGIGYLFAKDKSVILQFTVSIILVIPKTIWMFTKKYF